MTDYVRICPKCKLVYSPDERIHRDANEICPKCGTRLIPETEDYKDE